MCYYVIFKFDILKYILLNILINKSYVSKEFGSCMFFIKCICVVKYVVMIFGFMYVYIKNKYVWKYFVDFVWISWVFFSG